ncbi:SpdD protein [Streptomyces cinerochromogenes]|uniref:SpdD protein n=1 Tax=Streptomyces cinerochromogenes TaxID=66422 RepID=UPI0036991372
MFLPKYPDSPTPPSAHTHVPIDPAPVRRGLPSLPIDQKTVVAVLGGVVLTALLAAVAITAISVTVAAIVLRSLLRDQHRH